MGEEADDCYELDLLGGGGGDDRVLEWESGLPGAEELTPLSQQLVPPGLATAFRIPPEPGRNLLDVHRASAATVSRLRRAPSTTSSSTVIPAYQEEAENNKRERERESSKRPRLVWTPQLHKRFVDVVAHLGIKNAVPKTIMQLMNVEGLTRENVASHLQKYRLYVKRMQGLSNEGPSPSDHIFASTPVPHSLVHEPQAQVPVQVQPYAHAAAYHHPMAMAGGHGHGVSSYPHYHYNHADK